MSRAAKDGYHPRNLYVAGLPTNFKDASLAKLFAEYGVIESARVMHATSNQQAARRVGFVMFKTNEGADAAVRGLDGSALGDGTITVRYAKKQASASGMIVRRVGKAGLGLDESSPRTADGSAQDGGPAPKATSKQANGNQQAPTVEAVGEERKPATVLPTQQTIPLSAPHLIPVMNPQPPIVVHQVPIMSPALLPSPAPVQVQFAPVPGQVAVPTPVAVGFPTPPAPVPSAAVGASPMMYFFIAGGPVQAAPVLAETLVAPPSVDTS